MQDAGSSHQTPFADLLLAVFNSILEVFLLCAAGYILAKNGILDKKTQKQINRLNVSLFTPALLFSKVAFFLTPEKLKELWIIPIWFVIVTTASMAIGCIFGWLFNLRKSQQSFVMAAAMFMNSNALPIALMQSLVVSVPDLAWGSDDNKNAMLGRALTYLTMYSTLGMVVRYSYGVSLLSRADTILVPATAEERTPLLADPELGNGASALFTHPSSSTLNALPSSPSLYKGKPISSHASSRAPSPPPVGSPPSHLDLPETTAVKRPAPLRRNTTFYNSFPNSPNASRTDLPTWDDSTTDFETEDEHDVEAGGRAIHPSECPHPSLSHRIHHFFHHTLHLRTPLLVVKRLCLSINNFMTVPLWSASLSLVVACVDPVKHALEHHMQPLNEAISISGACAVPLTLVVLGAYFYKPKPEGEKPRKEDAVSFGARVKGVLGLAPRYATFEDRDSALKKKKENPGETKTVVLAIASRMIITPILLVPVMAWATTSDWHAVFEDPVFVTVNTILLCSPPALTLAQITAAVSGDAFERLISKTIFWSYCVVTPPVTIGCVLLGLWLAKL
ncbi:hypothetical protein M413DRAFT_448659 [Hebeloma cylindrosporum]|uniref:Auxin efflux carrier n=1 Tax=Hebeloma cylindrosporum TaxID=76867 RepID=A0A0C2XH26_HEBCY|nr:hypothetical protein M413DRAFT_448659 [Hebeloma cylindrosporum h7]